jgi:hypothetical protein
MIFYNVFMNMKFRKGKVMNFVTGDFNAVGTCLQGHINTSYDRLVETFGEPTIYEGNETDGKVQAEWTIKFTDGILATVYDWKTDVTPESVTEWNIGGHSDAAVYNVIDAVL